MTPQAFHNLGPREKPQNQQDPTEHPLEFLPFRLGRLFMAIEAFFVSTLAGPECHSLLSEALPDGIDFVDLAKVMNQEPRPQQYILVKMPEIESQILFAVDQILRLTRVQLQKIRPLPPVTKENIAVPFLFGVTSIQKKVTYLLDPLALATWNQETRRE